MQHWFSGKNVENGFCDWSLPWDALACVTDVQGSCCLADLCSSVVTPHRKTWTPNLVFRFAHAPTLLSILRRYKTFLGCVSKRWDEHNRVYVTVVHPAPGWCYYPLLGFPATVTRWLPARALSTWIILSPFFRSRYARPSTHFTPSVLY